jgi:hypothetical protein
MLPMRALNGPLIAALLTVSRFAAADPQQCIMHNNDGADHRTNHRLLAARDAYAECVADPGCPDVVRAECESALAELREAIPSLLVSILDDQQQDIVDATLELDGKIIARDGRPIDTDPGPHELVASWNGVTKTIQIVAQEQEVNRQLQIVLEMPRAPAQLSSVQKSELAPEPPLARRTPSLIPSYVLGGLGAAAAGSFGYFSIAGHIQVAQLDKCKPGCRPSDVNEVKTEYLLADVSLGVSVVALATAGYLMLRRSHEVHATSGTLSLDVVATSQAAGLSVRLLE